MHDEASTTPASGTLRVLLVALEELTTALPAPDGAAETVAGEEDRRRSELLAVCYRLLFAEIVARAGVAVSTTEALSGLVTPGLDEHLLAVAADRARAALRVGAGPTRDAAGLGRLHEDLLAWRLVAADGRWSWRLDGRLRKAGGSYFTPPPLAEHLLSETLDRLLEPADPGTALPRVLDPACGAGAFLVPAARRLVRHARRGGLAPAEARRAGLARVHGVDLDPAVLELARVVLWLDTWRELPAREADPPTAEDVMVPVPLAVGDAVGDLPWQQTFPDVFVDGGVRAGEFAVGDFEVGEFEAGDFDAGSLEPGGFDVVVANPPFANQLERLTARDRRGRGSGAEAGAGAVSAYTDLSAVFLLHALGWVRPGGWLGFVQPQSVLAARDAAAVRRAVVSAGALTSLWVGESGLFDAAVPTCALVVHHGGEQGSVRRWRGADLARLPDRVVESAHLRLEWGFLLAAAMGVPEVALVAGRVLGEMADCTADFRDQYYGLEPYVHEAGPERRDTQVPLVTSGLIDPATCLWGERTTRFLKQVWQAPVVDLDAMAEDPRLTAWAGRRLVAKVLLATQGRVLEAVADADGAWLPSVPVVTIRPHDPDTLWRVLAVLLAPPVCAVAATRYAGSALNPKAIKLSAKQVAGLPLPTVEPAWEEGARQVREAQEASTPEERREVLVRAGRTLCAAYGLSVGGTASAGPPADDLMAWWSARLP